MGFGLTSMPVGLPPGLTIEALADPDADRLPDVFATVGGELHHYELTPDGASFESKGVVIDFLLGSLTLQLADHDGDGRDDAMIAVLAGIGGEALDFLVGTQTDSGDLVAPNINFSDFRRRGCTGQWAIWQDLDVVASSPLFGTGLRSTTLRYLKSINRWMVFLRVHFCVARCRSESRRSARLD